MTVCLLCTNDILRGLPMHDEEVRATVARELIRGMLAATTTATTMLKDVKPPPRLGTCMVERCARLVESSCGGCRGQDCQRCAIATELRTAEERLNAERDAELAALAVTDPALEQQALDSVVDNLCAEHVSFGTVLVTQWYSRHTLPTAVGS